MVKIIYENSILMGSEENPNIEYLANRTNPKLVKKVIDFFSNHYTDISYIFNEHILKPENIDFDKIFFAIENEQIKFYRGRFDIKMEKKLFTSSRYEIDGLRSMEVNYNDEIDDCWTVKIIFFNKKDTSIEDEIHVTYLNRDIFYRHNLRIYNGQAFVADIGFNDGVLK